MNNNSKNKQSPNRNLPNGFKQKKHNFTSQITKILNENNISKKNKKNNENEKKKTKVKQKNIIQTKNIDRLSQKSDWISLGDMHGDIQKFVNDLKHINYIQTKPDINQQIKENKPVDQILKSISIQNPNTKLIFTGDIMADRQSNGLDIIYILNHLQQIPDSKISIIAGNHDGFLISFLVGLQDHNLYLDTNYLEQLLTIGQAKGLLELAKYQPNIKSIKNISLKNLNSQIVLKSMQKDKKGKTILQAITNMKLIEYHNGTLFLHTPITDAIVGILNNRSSQKNNNLKKVTYSINSTFQNYLKYKLLGNENINYNKESFEMYFNCFLHTNNTTPQGRKTLGMDSNLKSLQEKQGVQSIIHGHTQNGGSIDTTHPKNSKYPVKIICNDYKYGSKLPSCIGGNKNNIYIPTNDTD